MMQKFAPALACLCSLHCYACAPEAADEPSYDASVASLVDGAAANDAHAADTALPGADGSPADASSPSGSRQDSGPKQEDAGGQDASVPDAQGLAQDASAADTSAPRDALSDTSVAAGAKPSAGCGNSARPSAGRVSVQGSHNFLFPASYDGKQPFPLLIGFHAANNPIEQIENLTKGSAFETNYVRAFPKSKGSAWDYGADIGKVLAMYDALTNNHCVDLNRVFATGHSSGAQLIVQILTPAHKTDADRFGFKAVAPVAASRYGSVSRAIPVMYIQGQRDNVRNSDGNDVVKEFTAANGCGAASAPYAGVAACMSSGKSVTSGCVQYQACKVPTVWCSHDDPQYGTTNHGWPCFATKAMYDFFASMP